VPRTRLHRLPESICEYILLSYCACKIIPRPPPACRRSHTCLQATLTSCFGPAWRVPLLPPLGPLDLPTPSASTVDDQRSSPNPSNGADQSDVPSRSTDAKGTTEIAKLCSNDHPYWFWKGSAPASYVLVSFATLRQRTEAGREREKSRHSKALNYREGNSIDFCLLAVLLG
jgi:hypothetical protein